MTSSALLPRSISSSTTRPTAGWPARAAPLQQRGTSLRPQKVIDATQAWFWSRAWQERVARSIDQIEAGEGERFETDEEFLAALDE